jgi:excinuclease UvrABC ATPase subunit
VTVSFPLGRFIAVTGVSGSGRSTLVDDILHTAPAKHIHRAHRVPGRHRTSTGIEQLNKVVQVDQSPIGRSPRSNPATCAELFDVGLGCVRLGQAATTLSGGEAQRVKLAAELQRRGRGRTLYVLDEPTTGLHVDDVRKLLEVLHRFVEAGNTVVVIEHNPRRDQDRRLADRHGPEGGHRGGTVVAQGTPEQVAAQPDSYTGQFLQGLLEVGRA